MVCPNLKTFSEIIISGIQWEYVTRIKEDEEICVKPRNYLTNIEHLMNLGLYSFKRIKVQEN